MQIDNERESAARAFYLRRADSYHSALFVIGILLVVQVTAFANLVGGGGLVCQTQTLPARLAVFASLFLFLAVYHLAIVWTARMEAHWRALARVDDGALTKRLAFAIMAINGGTAAMAMGLFGAGIGLQVC
ncbi:MAG: hypothetical protein AAFW83_06295 [Pseudomonadota bacterium]